MSKQFVYLPAKNKVKEKKKALTLLCDCKRLYVFFICWFWKIDCVPHTECVDEFFPPVKLYREIEIENRFGIKYWECERIKCFLFPSRILYKCIKFIVWIGCECRKRERNWKYLIKVKPSGYCSPTNRTNKNMKKKID